MISHIGGDAFAVWIPALRKKKSGCSAEGVKGLVSDSVCIDLYQKTYESQVLYPVGEKYPFYNGISIEPTYTPDCVIENDS